MKSSPSITKLSRALNPANLLIVIAIAASIASAGAATIYVSTTGNDVSGTGAPANPYETIQKALDGSQSRDVILVAPGDYSGNYTISKSDLSIVSQLGPSATRITSAARDSVFYITADGKGAVIDGFTITGGTGRPQPSTYGFDYYGGAIHAQASLVVRNCILTGNGAGTPRVNSCTFGGAIYSAGQAEDVVLVENCVLANNFAWASG